MLVQFVLFCVTLYTLYSLLKPKRPPNFPPGPEAYPLVGSALALFKLDKTIPGACEKCGEVYGPVCGLWMGKNRAIIVNGWKTVREVLAKEEFSGRPPLFFSRHPVLNKELGMIMVSNNELWKVQRRFSLRTFRDWGFGKSSLESVIQEEIAETFEQLEKKRTTNNGVVCISDVYGVPIVNILWAVLAGFRFKHDDEKLKALLQKLYEIMRSQGHVNNMINDYPFLRHLPFFSSRWGQVLRIKEEHEKFIEDEINEHIKTRDPSAPRDFIDEYLEEMDKQKGDKDTTFFREQLVNLCTDVFTAGSETTSNSLAYALLYMILHPDVQEKVFNEINEVIGQDRLPSYEDRTKLPYTEAVLCEVQRLSNIAPMAVPHYTLQNTTLNGYSIPKGTWVFVSLSGVHMDKELWKEPERFNPERFLDSQGKFKGKPEYLIPFGLGPRFCVGESLARTNFFLFFAATIQRYRVSVPAGHEKPSTEPISGFTVSPQPFDGHLTVRTELQTKTT